MVRRFCKDNSFGFLGLARRRNVSGFFIDNQYFTLRMKNNYKILYKILGKILFAAVYLYQQRKQRS